MFGHWIALSIANRVVKRGEEKHQDDRLLEHGKFHAH